MLTDPIPITAIDCVLIRESQCPSADGPQETKSKIHHWLSCFSYLQTDMVCLTGLQRQDFLR